MASLGKKLRRKNEKGERTKEENYIKKEGKGLKNASFWAINSTFFAPPATNLFVRVKKCISKVGGGRKLSKCTIYISLVKSQFNFIIK